MSEFATTSPTFSNGWAEFGWRRFSRQLLRWRWDPGPRCTKALERAEKQRCHLQLTKEAKWETTRSWIENWDQEKPYHMWPRARKVWESKVKFNRIHLIYLLLSMNFSQSSIQIQLFTLIIRARLVQDLIISDHGGPWVRIVAFLASHFQCPSRARFYLLHPLSFLKIDRNRNDPCRPFALRSIHPCTHARTRCIVREASFWIRYLPRPPGSNITTLNAKDQFTLTRG